MQAFYRVHLFCFRAPWNHNTVFRYGSKSCKYPAIADVSFALLQSTVGWQSSVQWTDVASYQAVCRCQVQNAANATRLRIVHRCFHTEVLPQRHVFTQAFAHTHAFAQRWFYTNTFTHRCFTQGCFYKKKITHTHVRALLNTDAFTLRCCWGMLLHARAFTQGFFWHKVAFTHRNFYSKYYYAEIFFHTEIYICTRMFF